MLSTFKWSENTQAGHGRKAVDGGDPVTVTDNRVRSFTKNRTATEQEFKEVHAANDSLGRQLLYKTAGAASYHTGWVESQHRLRIPQPYRLTPHSAACRKAAHFSLLFAECVTFRRSTCNEKFGVARINLTLFTQTLRRAPRLPQSSPLPTRPRRKPVRQTRAPGRRLRAQLADPAMQGKRASYLRDPT
jgi:hypothetical protein